MGGEAVVSQESKEVFLFSWNLGGRIVDWRCCRGRSVKQEELLCNIGGLLAVGLLLRGAYKNVQGDKLLQL
jgi:hypothetical protein